MAYKVEGQSRAPVQYCSADDPRGPVRMSVVFETAIAAEGSDRCRKWNLVVNAEVPLYVGMAERQER